MHWEEAPAITRANNAQEHNIKLRKEEKQEAGKAAVDAVWLVLLVVSPLEQPLFVP